ncbi:MAG: amidohydrolase family protein, partial [Opitutaceae bacterium]|nr:amidohydrolase family protein [Verrucomicrobiales bacterium]
MSRPFAQLFAMLGVLAAVALPPLAVAGDFLPPGHRPLPLGIHALVGGRVVIKPGQVIEGGTVVIRDGLIEAVGKGVQPPPDARIWDSTGLTIYAGFIDPYLTTTSGASVVSTTRVEPISGSVESLTAGGVNFFGVPGEERDPGSAGPGSDLSVITPERRMAASYVPDSKLIETLHELGFAAANVVPEKGILRGLSAFVALAELNPNELILKPEVAQHIAFDSDGGRDGAYPKSLMGVIASVRQSFFDAQHYVATRTRTPPVYNPAWESLRPAMEGTQSVVFEPGSALMVDRAARVARELNLKFQIVSSGQEWRRPELARDTGASFIVPLNFPEIPKMPEEDDWQQVSLDQLRAWDWAAENPHVLARVGLELALTTHGLSDRKSFRKNLRLALNRGFGETNALAALTTVPAKLCGLDDRLGSIEAGKLANLTVVDGNYFDEKSKVREVWVLGRIYRTPVEKAKLPVPVKDATAELREKKEDPKDKRATDLRDLLKKRVARMPGEGRGTITNPPAVLVRNATIWTSGPDGILTNASMLIERGKISMIGAFQAKLSATTMVVDGTGLHVTPGLIDAHSHTAILGGVNEATLPSTAMVRIGDVVNSETDNLYQQLAGGLTVANLLHGSANPIGGQNSVIKLRDGAAPDDLKLADAPLGIKFALGENVKQSNAGEKNVTRFPQTRMGVRTFFVNRFTAARQYLDAWDNFRKNGGASPRRDLELEALGEIIEDKRWVHCHSYRQDEILWFLRTMEEFGVKVATLQHVLEGYKVADEIARHGAGGSTFSDWWAFKFEVYDAIPYNGSVMHERGVMVSFNSDS